MASQRPETPQSSKSAATDPLDLATTQVGKVCQDVGAKESLSKPDNPQPKQSTATTVLVLVSVLLAVFLVALDRTIISTAIPQITDEFNSFTDVGWYGSAYLLTFCALQLLYGRLYTFFPITGILLTSILLFEVASALCGAAPNSITFIIGRAIAGVGAAGIMAGSIVCIAYVIPLEKRPLIQGMFGGLMGVASIAGPLIGGGFTSNVTWRWCFYINLPIGGVAMLVIFFFLDVPNYQGAASLSFAKKLMRLDALGTLLLAPGVVSLLLALQWGGQTYTWSNGRIIALLTLTGVLLVAFAAVQILLPTTATLPPRIFKQRTVVAAVWSTLCINCGNYIVVYFLPIWFQSIKGVSAAESGIRTLPLMLSMVAASIIGGFANSKIGYYTPLAIVGSCIMTVGAGLFTTFQVDTGEGKWISYQILYGIGLGLCFQVPNLAVQVTLPKKDVPTGLTLMLFSSLLGAAIFVAVGENLLANQLVQRLSGVPGVDPRLIKSAGATSLLDSLPANLREMGRTAYNEALRKVFQAGLIPSCLSVLGAASLEWKSVKKPQPPAAVEE